MMTHPAVEERIVQIDTDMAVRDSAHVAAPPDPSLILKKVVIRLKALYDAPDNALPYFRSEVAKNPSDAQMAYGYALVLARTGKRQEAAEYLKAALAQNALDPVILGDLGRVYFLDGQYEKALSTLSGATSSGDANPEALFYLGRTQMELGDLKAAVTSFENLRDVFPDHIPTYQFLGECYGRLSVMPEAHFNLGIYHYRTGDMRNARYHLLKAREGMADATKLETIDKVLKSISRPSQEAPQK
jgi:predicted Zn-dependent protease